MDVISISKVFGMSTNRSNSLVGSILVPWPSWLRRGANNAKISSSILLGTISFFNFLHDLLTFFSKKPQL